MNKEKNNQIIISSCSNHLGGILGEAILRFFIKEKLIKINDNKYEITKKGWEELEIIGIDINKLKLKNEDAANICYESNHGIQYEHIGSYLGDLLTKRMIELKWLTKKDKKEFEITEKGFSGLETMGIRIRSIL